MRLMLTWAEISTPQILSRHLGRELQIFLSPKQPLAIYSKNSSTTQDFTILRTAARLLRLANYLYPAVFDLS